MSLDWREDAVCKKEGQDPELFFPVGTSGPAQVQTAQAKAVCHRCSVASDCLSWALQTGTNSGVFGGLDETERRNLRRRRVLVA